MDAQDETGVWTGTQKIASLGIGVRKWVSFHGAALNVFEDPQAFQGLNPCGFRSSVMTNIEAFLGRKIELGALKKELRNKLSFLL